MENEIDSKIKVSYEKIPHAGDKASLDRCGQQHQYHGRVDQEYPKTHFFLNEKNHLKQKNSKTNRDMPKLEIYPSTRGLSSIRKRNFQHVLYGKISKKITFFCTAILDNFQTKKFKSETPSFHYFSPSISDFGKWGQKDVLTVLQK